MERSDVPFMESSMFKMRNQVSSYDKIEKGITSNSNPLNQYNLKKQFKNQLEKQKKNAN